MQTRRVHPTEHLKKRLFFRVSEKAARWHAVLFRNSYRLLSRSSNRLGDFLLHALDENEREYLTTILHDESYLSHGQSLAQWEIQWLMTALPPPPADILVGGAGDGREMMALRAMGYRVDGFDPASHSADVIRAGYQDLVRDTGQVHSPVTRFKNRSYDACLLGYGSFGHVIGEGQRRAVLLAIKALTKEGTILCTVNSSAIEVQLSRAALLGRKVGSWRGVALHNEVASYGPWNGFSQAVSLQELERHAETLKLDLILDGPHGAWHCVSFRRR